METKLERIKINGTITDTLIAAVEMADEIEDVLILYRKKNNQSGFMYADAVTYAMMNWMVDTFKAWLFTNED